MDLRGRVREGRHEGAGGECSEERGQRQAEAVSGEDAQGLAAAPRPEAWVHAVIGITGAPQG